MSWIKVPLKSDAKQQEIKSWLESCEFKNNQDYIYYENQYFVGHPPDSIVFICKNKQMETILRLRWL